MFNIFVSFLTIIKTFLKDESWDFGTGAGFYVDATEEKWKENYNMYSYVSDELPAIVATGN